MCDGIGLLYIHACGFMICTYAVCDYMCMHGCICDCKCLSGILCACMWTLEVCVGMHDYSFVCVYVDGCVNVVVAGYVCVTLWESGYRIRKPFQSDNNKCWWECREIRTLIHCFWEYKMVRPLWKTVWQFLKRWNSELPHNPAKNMYTNVHSNIIYNCQKVETI